MKTGHTRKLTSHQRAVLSRIAGLIEYWQITAEELDMPEPLVPYVEAPPAIKYQHPKTGEAWDGEGQQPDWLRRALSQEGYLVSELVPPPPSEDEGEE